MFEASWIWLVGAALASILGFAWLALAMDGHWHQVYGDAGRPTGWRNILRMFGAAGLLVSAALCFVADHPAMAALVWVMLLAASAPLIALTLAWKPRLLRIVWPCRVRA
ncbi:MAG: DUF3325 domain-containing protein [Burkholderiaceae bacterium]